MTNKHELLGAPKHANQHRLSRLIMEAKTDELRFLAAAVECYTDELIAALEAAEKRIAELRRLVILGPMPVIVPKEMVHQLYHTDTKICRTCNDGLRGGCSSCAFYKP